MTEAQKKVIQRLREIGGAGWLGPAIPHDGKLPPGHYGAHMANMRAVFGKRDFERYRNLMKKHCVSDKGVRCSNGTSQRMWATGLIEPVEGLSGVWKLTDPCGNE